MKKRSRKKKRTIRSRLLSSPFVLMLLLVGFTFLANFTLQVLRKPAEIIALLPLGSPKAPSQTWEAYGDDFLDYATDIATPDFLAALAQVESSGNPLATPSWTWSWSTLKDDFTRVYRPASTSVGLYQFTNGTFKYAKNFCIAEGRVYKQSQSSDDCWFNWTYLRTWPSHSIEMASAYLTALTKKLLKQTRQHSVSLKQKHRVAAIIHLCGKNRARRYIQQGFHLQSMRRCGSHNPAHYVSKIERLKRRFSAYLSPTDSNLLADN